MTELLSDPDLDRAADNVRRIATFFVQRRSWPLAGDAHDALETTREAAGALAEALRDLFPDLPLPPGPEPPPPSLEPGVVDRYRLLKLGAFLSQLERWFRARAGHRCSPAGRVALAGIVAALDRIDELADELAERTPTPGADSSTPSPPPAPVAIPPGAPQRLVMEDDDETPLLVELKGKVELTELACERLGAFLEAYAMTLSPADRRQLEHKLRRWLEATPDGQVLVLKMSTLHGRLEPYPVYERKPADAGA